MCRGWSLAAVDVKKAFLKGITYEDLARTTNEPSLEVNFEWEADAVESLRQIPGYEDVDLRLEVLQCTKPGTGCKGAPGCVANKLS